MSMFCYQCQETAMGTGCTLKGVCGKTSEVANLQDLLLFVVRGIAVYNEHLRKDGHPSEQADKFIYDALFITITNANFDKVAITEKIKEGLKLKNELANKVKIENAPDECLWNGSEDEFEEKSKTVGVLRTSNEDIRSLKELVPSVCSNNSSRSFKSCPLINIPGLLRTPRLTCETWKSYWNKQRVQE